MAANILERCYTGKIVGIDGQRKTGRVPGVASGHGEPFFVVLLWNVAAKLVLMESLAFILELVRWRRTIGFQQSAVLLKGVNFKIM